MASRLDNIPIYERKSVTMDARHYNVVRLAELRIGSEIHLRLEGMRSLMLIIAHDEWVVVDAELNDAPIMAWLNFDASHRDAIHTSVPCELRYYHAHAEKIEEQVLSIMDDVLDMELHAEKLKESTVTPITKKDE